MSAATGSRSAKDSAKSTGGTLEPQVTVEDLRRKAEQVRDLTKSEVRRTVNQVTSEELTRTLVIAGVAVVAAISLAYYLGSRRR